MNKKRVVQENENKGLGFYIIKWQSQISMNIEQSVEIEINRVGLIWPALSTMLHTMLSSAKSR